MLLCILLWWQCVEIGLNECKREISDTLHYPIFFILFCYTKLHTDPNVNKDLFLLNFLAKTISLSCSKIAVCLNAYSSKTPAFSKIFQTKVGCTTLFRRC